MENIKRNRNYYIDNIRGLAIISVIFIHTVFWSGGSYVPEYMRNLALLIRCSDILFINGNVNVYNKKYKSYKANNKTNL